MEIVLASGSPRRREIMSLITDKFTVRPVNADEKLMPGAPLPDEVVRLAVLKAETALKLYPEAVCVGSDTMVTLDGIAFGKPENEEHAEWMLRKLRGRTHEVLTGTAVASNGNKTLTLLNRSFITFRNFGDDELLNYIKTKEPLDKAGAYGIQGKGALLIEKINGDYYSVMGLPASGLYVMLKNIGAV